MFGGELLSEGPCKGEMGQGSSSLWVSVREKVQLPKLSPGYWPYVSRKY